MVREKRNYYTIARGSVHECVAILRILKIQGFLVDSEFTHLYQQLTAISNMLSGLIKSMAAVR